MINKFLLLACALVIAGCQAMPYQPYARDVKKKPQQGGVIALKTEHREEDRAKADTMMKNNCGTLPVKVVEEGEVAVGQTTSGSAKETNQQGTQGQQVGTLFGVPVMSGAQDPSKSTSTSTTTMAINEWQINYECLQAGKAQLGKNQTGKKVK